MYQFDHRRESRQTRFPFVGESRLRHDGRVVERFQLLGADHVVVVEVERAKRPADHGEFGLGERRVLVSVELIEEGVGSSGHLPPEL